MRKLSFNTPGEALEFLLDGNRKFIEGKPEIKNYCFDSMLKSLEEGQKPYAIVLSCSDSRVCPEILFDTGLGELFCVRTAGNTIGPNVLESIEYAVKKLKIKLLIILSHQDCGVMKYAMNAPLYNDCFENLIYQVQSVKHEKGLEDYDEVAKEYLEVCKHRLLVKSNIINHAFEHKGLKIVKTYFDIETGRINVIG